jgi:ribosomal protein S18 acetylase RimI-like enzyme
VFELAPLSADVTAALRLLRTSAQATTVPGEKPEDYLPAAEVLLTSGAALGRLFTVAGHAIGVALWEPPSPVGLFVYDLYLESPHASANSYRAALAEIERTVGPIAFVLRSLVGLSEADESSLMRSLGFERYGRSEMRFPPSAPLPELRPPEGIAFRRPLAEDAAALASLNTRAYAGGLDRYLFLTDLDPAKDSESHVGDVLGGRFGPLVDAASIVAEAAGIIVGACIVVRAPYGPLIVNVMVDPSRQGRGIGQSMLVASLRALRETGEPVAALNVTEGNASAVRAYEKVGFVRTIGPQWSWYSRRRVPIEDHAT